MTESNEPGESSGNSTSFYGSESGGTVTKRGLLKSRLPDMKPLCLDIASSMKTTALWSLISIATGGVIWAIYGHSTAGLFAEAYFIQTVLSMDNLLTFFVIYDFYHVPRRLRPIALTWGFVGCVIFQLTLLTVAHEVVHRARNFDLVLGVLMMVMGIGSITQCSSIDETDMTTKQMKPPLISRPCRVLPHYVDDGSFFITVAVSDQGEAVVPWAEPHSYGMICSESAKNLSVQSKNRVFATMLFWVVLCQETTDAIFALDSSSLISVEVDNLVVSFSAVIVSLATVRSTFFILETLSNSFRLLKYGIAFVLMFMGTRLFLLRLIQIPHAVTACVIFGALLTSIGLSFCFDSPAEKKKRRPTFRHRDDSKDRIQEEDEILARWVNQHKKF